jgi:hypothetical protein
MLPAQEKKQQCLGGRVQLTATSAMRVYGRDRVIGSHPAPVVFSRF